MVCFWNALVIFRGNQVSVCESRLSGEHTSPGSSPGLDRCVGRVGVQTQEGLSVPHSPPASLSELVCLMMYQMETSWAPGAIGRFCPSLGVASCSCCLCSAFPPECCAFSAVLQPVSSRGLRALLRCTVPTVPGAQEPLKASRRDGQPALKPSF